MQKGKVACLIGDFYHQPGPIREMLEALFQVLGWEGEFFLDPEEMPWKNLDRYLCFVLAKEARTDPVRSRLIWNTQEMDASLFSFVEGGGGLLVLHNGLASYDPEGVICGLSRGRFLYHPPEQPEFQIRPVSQGQPAFPAFSVVDEKYFVQVKSAKTEIVLESYSPDYGTSAAAWKHSEGKGRVFCFTPGHNPPVLAHVPYRSVVLEALKWLSKH
jgi:hypothetical protein